MSSNAGGIPEQVYIDVGFLRIQRYLARTTQLRGRRLASAGMVEATDSRAIADRLPRGLALANDEAGVADGVVSLKLRDPGPDGRSDRVDQVVTAVLKELRAEFPAAELQAVWGAGETYVSAYAVELGPRMSRGEVRLDLPVSPEFPAAMACRLCRLDPAIQSVPRPGFPGERHMVCADCAQRLRRRGRIDTASAEQRLMSELKLDEAPDALEDLAPLGAPDTKRNHLATIYIDGNAVGLFFKKLVAAASQRADLQELKRDQSQYLSLVTEVALQAGTQAVVVAMGVNEPGCLPVVPHVVGGDDVLVSVPASYAWPFAVAYLRSFQDEMREHVQRHINARYDLDLPVPSASAGIVFARHNEPMYLLVDLVEERLRAAKRATRGQASSVDFLDLTVDGPHGTGERPLLLSALRDPATLRALDELASLPESHQARLAEALRQHQDEVSAVSLALRKGRDRIIEPFLSGSHGQEPPSGIRLAHALRIARWWRSGSVSA